MYTDALQGVIMIVGMVVLVAFTYAAWAGSSRRTASSRE